MLMKISTIAWARTPPASVPSAEASLSPLLPLLSTRSALLA